MTQTSDRPGGDLRDVVPPRTLTATASHGPVPTLSLVGSDRLDTTDRAIDALRADDVVVEQQRTTTGLAAERRHDTTTITITEETR